MTKQPAQGAGPLGERIAKWAELLLEPYLRRYPSNSNREAKQVHDAIDHVVDLHSWEVYILDSPLVQRLRYIRQLGVGHFLFPTCGYSRFEHSLGALETASQMFDYVRLAPVPGRTAEGQIYRDEGFTARRDIVRLAALLHDIGHCIFSHVSERFYGRHSDVDAAVRELEAAYKTKITASEAITLLILKSDAFLTLLRASVPRRSEYTEEEMVDLICACVAGSKAAMAPDCFMAEIVNGPVDCDKLDYLNRDAHMAGVPSSLDIDRLLSKLRLVRVRSEEDREVFSLAVVPSGARALDELLVSRIFLYDKFYYHPKVMAAEELIRHALKVLTVAFPTLQDPAVLLSFGDDEFLSQGIDTLRARFGKEVDAQALQYGCELLRRARSRDLPKRAFAFARRFLPELPELTARFETKGKVDAVPRGLYEFATLSRLLEDPVVKEDQTELIRQHTKELTGKNTEVFVGVQSVQRAAGSINLPVVLPDGVVEQKPSFLFKSSEWTEAYALNKQSSYVFAYDNRPAVHLATERVFAESGELFFAPNCWKMAKVAPRELELARKTLPDSWLPYRLPPDHLREGRQTARIHKQRSRLASYLNAVHPRFGPQLVESWVSQFPDADLCESALAFVEHLTYVEPSQILQRFKETIDKNAVLRKATWLQLRPRGGKGQSADTLLHDLKELPVAMESFASMSAERITAAGHLVFFDDSLNSGVQSTCLVGSWFGDRDECANPSDADKGGALPDDVQAALRAVPITFCFYSRHPRGEESLRARCQTLGLNVRDVLCTIDSSRPEFRVSGFQASSEASTQRFVDFLKRRGETLLMQRVKAGEAGWDAQRAKDWALGFSAIDLTLAYRHSVSTSTPVALWFMSTELTDPWLPLFPRKRTPFLEAIGAREESPERPDYPD